MARYAENTTVSVDRSRSEIERTLQRYGADSFFYGWDEDAAVIGFRMQGRHIRFKLAIPDCASEEFTHTPTRRKRRTEEDEE